MDKLEATGEKMDFVEGRKYKGEEGCYYECEECGKIFFISWEDNSCQCGGCVEEKCWSCMQKLGKKDGRY